MVPFQKCHHHCTYTQQNMRHRQQFVDNGPSIGARRHCRRPRQYYIIIFQRLYVKSEKWIGAAMLNPRNKHAISSVSTTLSANCLSGLNFRPSSSHTRVHATRVVLIDAKWRECKFKKLPWILDYNLNWMFDLCLIYWSMGHISEALNLLALILYNETSTKIRFILKVCFCNLRSDVVLIFDIDSIFITSTWKSQCKIMFFKCHCDDDDDSTMIVEWKLNASNFQFHFSCQFQ